MQREDGEHIAGLLQNMDGARQYIKLLEEEERKKGAELEQAGEYARKLEQLAANQEYALAAIRQEDVPRLQREHRRRETGMFALFKIHLKEEGLLATSRRSLAYAAGKLKRH